MLSGIEGLYEIFTGSLDANRVYLVEGQPGNGKTTLAPQFLLKSARLGEKTMHIYLLESGPELQLIAGRHRGVRPVLLMAFEAADGSRGAEGPAIGCAARSARNRCRAARGL